MKEIIRVLRHLKEVNDDIPLLREEIERRKRMLEEYSSSLLEQYRAEASSVRNRYLKNLEDLTVMEIGEWKENAAKRLNIELENQRKKADEKMEEAVDLALNLILGSTKLDH